MAEHTGPGRKSPGQEKILRRWMKLHLWAVWCLAASALLVELAMAVVTNHAQGFDSPSTADYLVKYLLIPSGLNGLLAAAATLAGFSKSAPVRKYYAVSLALSAESLVLYTIHSIFPAVTALFLVGVLLTTTYGDYLLTTVTALFSLAGAAVSGLFWAWDASKRPVLGSAIDTVDFLLNLLILAGVYVFCLAVIYFERQKNEAILRAEQERASLRQAARKDSLTGLYNRTALREAFDQLEERREKASLVMVDLDRFKALNDTYGHTQGDICLQDTAAALRAEMGENPVFRYGGDEFCALLWGEGAAEAAQRCRRAARRMERTGLCQRYGVSASFGVAEYVPELTAHQLLERADRALYRAKAAHGAVRVYEESMENQT